MKFLVVLFAAIAAASAVYTYPNAYGTYPYAYHGEVLSATEHVKPLITTAYVAPATSLYAAHAADYYAAPYYPYYGYNYNYDLPLWRKKRSEQ